MLVYFSNFWTGVSALLGKKGTNTQSHLLTHRQKPRHTKRCPRSYLL